MTSLNIILLLNLFVIFRTVIADEEYIINTKKCKIPNIKPFSEEVQELIKRWNYVACNTSELLTYITKANNVATLHIKEELTHHFSPGNFSCCYSDVIRYGSMDYPDVGIRISECKYFDKQLILNQIPVMVKCKWNETIVYENVHHPIIVQDFVKEKLKNNSTNRLSVLFIVVDSISRLNFMRSMPKTRQFLLENNFIEMKGYNKVGENTFPNFMALLTGFNLTHSLKYCNPYKLNKLDDCPMIWYDYRDFGYVTAYVEDYDIVNTFNYGGKKGFTKAPTDYYFKSYMAAAEKLGILEIFGMPYCTGPETSGERILNLAMDFTETFKNYSTFGVFWMNTFSHNEINCPSIMDVKMEQFFENIRERGVLDDSIVIFLSDHGMRFGNIRFTRSGWYEERLPVNFISLPKMFKNRFNSEYSNLRKNSEQLTNTYDLYMTLQHILILSGVQYHNKSSMACPKCKSLFEEIPDRSCEDASISPDWCTCY